MEPVETTDKPTSDEQTANGGQGVGAPVPPPQVPETTEGQTPSGTQ